MKLKVNYEFLPERKSKNNDSLSWWKFQNSLLLRSWTAHTMATFVVIVSMAALHRSKTIEIEEKMISTIISCDKRTLRKAIEALEKMRLITRLEREEREERERDEWDEEEEELAKARGLEILKELENA